MADDKPPFASTPFNLPPEITQSLGDVVIAWARVEALLAEFLSYLLKADPGAMYVVTKDIAAGMQLKWIRALAAERFPTEDAQEDLKNLFDRIEIVRNERNALIHGVWNTGPEPGTACVQTLKLSQSTSLREELVTPPDLDELFREIQSVSDEFFVLCRTLKIL